MPSCIRLMPGLEEVVITRAPAMDAPMTMLMEASSLSACTKVPSTSSRRADMYSGTSFWGVMG